MSPDEFQVQLDRLKNTFGPRSYPGERSEHIFQCLKSLQIGVFEQLVTDAIAGMRSAPLLKDFNELLAKRNAKPDRQEWGDFFQETYNPANYDDTQVRERIQARINLIKDYAARKITKRQFDEGCDFYDMAAGIPLEEKINEI